MTALRLAVGPLMQQLGSGGPEVPDDIAELQFWFRADDQAEGNGVNVDDIVDQSGNSRDFVWSNARAVMTTGGPNSRKYLDFSGGNCRYSRANFMTGKTAGEVFVLLKTDVASPAATDTGLWRWSNDSTSCHWPYIDGNIYESWGRRDRTNTGNPVADLSSWTLYNVSSESAANGFKVRINDSLHYQTNNVGQVNFGSANLQIGYSNSTFHFDGQMAEMFAFDKVLTTDERDGMVAYINDFYSLSF